MKSKLLTTFMLTASLLWIGSAQAGKPVGITPNMMDATVMHGGKSVKIMRDQNNKAVVNPAFAKTSRPCPPFCIQPIVLAPGVETLGEREIIDYLVKMSNGDKSILVLDSRTPDWVQKGTIPGAVNIPWTALNPAKGADPISIGEIMEDRFGATSLEGLWDYSNAKTWSCSVTVCGVVSHRITSRTCLNSVTRRTRSSGIAAVCKAGQILA